MSIICPLKVKLNQEENDQNLSVQQERKKSTEEKSLYFLYSSFIKTA